MLLIAHISVALISLIFASFMVVKPSKRTVNISYMLAGLTLGSGTVLVLSTGSALLQACASGLTYFAVMMVMIHLARTKSVNI